jgi:V/A-type H+/Na+-transporting ATPase subunit E
MSAGAENIVESILSESHSRADDIIKEAEKQASEIIERGNIEAQKKKNEIFENAHKEADIRFHQIISDAKLNSKRKILEAREQLMEKTFHKAEEELKKKASSDSDDYINSLKKLTKEASIEIDGGSLEIFLKKEDVPKIEGALDSIAEEVSKKTGNKTTLKLGRAIHTIGGVSVKTENGNIEVNNTIEARMERFRSLLRLEVAKVLFK